MIVFLLFLTEGDLRGRRFLSELLSVGAAEVLQGIGDSCFGDWRLGVGDWDVGGTGLSFPA